MIRSSLMAWILLALGAAQLMAQAQAPALDHCRRCHAALEGALGEPARQFPEDVHATRGLTCAACHGGNPGEEDPAKAMDRKQGFIGVPQRTEVPQLCAQCHSDGAYMRAYNPSLRTDQLAQYWTSVHGQRLRKGDTRVAVCSSCHGIHNIRPASSSLSNVYPPQIPTTCGRCHADAEYMKAYKIPTNQLAEYRASVHFQTLVNGDLSAPTCATCHGNHGAAPPGVASVERVCGTCHVFQEQLFDRSPHKAPWQKLKLASCLTCHSNHRVEHPTDDRVGTGKDAFCVTCHQQGDGGWKAAQRIHGTLAGLDTAVRRAAAVLDRAERAGMEISEARLTQAGAQEQLIKARVDVHAFDAARVENTAKSGMDLAQKAYQSGEQALAEFAFRRKGLALSLFAIAFVVLSLWLLIRRLEGSPAGKRGPEGS